MQGTYLISAVETGVSGKLLIKTPKSLALVIFFASKVKLDHKKIFIRELSAYHLHRYCRC